MSFYLDEEECKLIYFYIKFPNYFSYFINVIKVYMTSFLPKVTLKLSNFSKLENLNLKEFDTIIFWIALVGIDVC